jgi:hypothetical protein
MIANRRVQFVMAVEAALSTGIALAELHRRGELPGRASACWGRFISHERVRVSLAQSHTIHLLE